MECAIIHLSSTSTAPNIMSYICTFPKVGYFVRHLDALLSCLSIISLLYVSWWNKHDFLYVYYKIVFVTSVIHHNLPAIFTAISICIYTCSFHPHCCHPCHRHCRLNVFDLCFLLTQCDFKCIFILTYLILSYTCYVSLPRPIGIPRYN